MYRIMTHRKENFRIVVRHEELVADPEGTLRRIADAVELPFDPGMLDAFDKLHVPVKGTLFGTRDELASRRAEGFSHRAHRESVPLCGQAEEAIAHYRRLLDMFGLPGDE